MDSIEKDSLLKGQGRYLAIIVEDDKEFYDDCFISSEWERAKINVSDKTSSKKIIQKIEKSIARYPLAIPFIILDLCYPPSYKPHTGIGYLADIQSQANLNSIPIIVITKDRDENHCDALMYGATDVIDKSNIYNSSSDDLERILRGIVDKKYSYNNILSIRFPFIQSSYSSLQAINKKLQKIAANKDPVQFALEGELGVGKLSIVQRMFPDKLLVVADLKLLKYNKHQQQPDFKKKDAIILGGENVDTENVLFVYRNIHKLNNPDIQDYLLKEIKSKEKSIILLLENNTTPDFLPQFMHDDKIILPRLSERLNDLEFWLTEILDDSSVCPKHYTDKPLQLSAEAKKTLRTYGENYGWNTNFRELKTDIRRAVVNWYTSTERQEEISAFYLEDKYRFLTDQSANNDDNRDLIRFKTTLDKHTKTLIEAGKKIIELPFKKRKEIEYEVTPVFRKYPALFNKGAYKMFVDGFNFKTGFSHPIDIYVLFAKGGESFFKKIDIQFNTKERAKYPITLHHVSLEALNQPRLFEVEAKTLASSKLIIIILTADLLASNSLGLEELTELVYSRAEQKYKNHPTLIPVIIGNIAFLPSKINELQIFALDHKENQNKDFILHYTDEELSLAVTKELLRRIEAYRDEKLI